MYLLDTRRSADRHRWLELGRAVRLHGEEICRNQRRSLIWEGHKAGRHIGYCHIEKLHNLELLPSTGFMVFVFPVKIEPRLGRVDPSRRHHRWLRLRAAAA